MTFTQTPTIIYPLIPPQTLCLFTNDELYAHWEWVDKSIQILPPKSPIMMTLLSCIDSMRAESERRRRGDFITYEVHFSISPNTTPQPLKLRAVTPEAAHRQAMNIFKTRSYISPPQITKIIAHPTS